MLYFSSAQRYRSRLKLVLRSTAEPAVGFEALRGLLREMDPRLALERPRTGEANRREAFTFERMQAQAVGVFAVFGFVLAVVGIFGVLSYAVSRRVREIGRRRGLPAGAARLPPGSPASATTRMSDRARPLRDYGPGFRLE